MSRTGRLIDEAADTGIGHCAGKANPRIVDEQFLAEHGDFNRCQGEEFALVLEGEVEVHTDLADGICRVLMVRSQD